MLTRTIVRKTDIMIKLIADSTCDLPDECKWEPIVSEEIWWKAYSINRVLTPNYIVTISSVLNSIPQVVEAEAGLYPSIKCPGHWMQEMRESAK